MNFYLIKYDMIQYYTRQLAKLSPNLMPQTSSLKLQHLNVNCTAVLFNNLFSSEHKEQIPRAVSKTLMNFIIMEMHSVKNAMHRIYTNFCAADMVTHLDEPFIQCGYQDTNYIYSHPRANQD